MNPFINFIKITKITTMTIITTKTIITTITIIAIITGLVIFKSTLIELFENQTGPRAWFLDARFQLKLKIQLLKILKKNWGFVFICHANFLGDFFAAMLVTF
jgi:hypothetical protein